MYELITDVPAALQPFYVEELRTEQVFDEEGEPVLADEEYTYIDEEGVEQTATRKVPTYHDVAYVVQIARPEAKAITDLERVIDLAKPQSVLDSFAQCVANGEYWQAFDDYHAYLAELARVEEHNANLPEPVTEEDGTVTEEQPLPLPEEPAHPALRTVAEVLEPYSLKLAKRQGITFKGVAVSLNEVNQNGLSALKSAFDLATEFDAHAEFFPINFHAETPQGVDVVQLENEAEFKQFGLEFILARKAFF